MIKFIEDRPILEDRPTNLILPITVKPGLQPHGTEEVLKFFPSLYSTIEVFQKSTIAVGDFFAGVTFGDINVYFLVTDYRPRPGANVNYLTQALSALSAHMRSMEGDFFMAALASSTEIPHSVVKKMVSGIFSDCQANLGFYFK